MNKRTGGANDPNHQRCYRSSLFLRITQSAKNTLKNVHHGVQFRSPSQTIRWANPV